MLYVYSTASVSVSLTALTRNGVADKFELQGAKLGLKTEKFFKKNIETERLNKRVAEHAKTQTNTLHKSLTQCTHESEISGIHRNLTMGLWAA